MRRAALVVLMAAVLAGSAGAQSGTSTLRLLVRDTANSPVAGAEVLVDSRVAGATDSAGRLRITGIAARTHTVVVRKIGFFGVTQQVRSAVDRELELVVELRRLVQRLPAVITRDTRHGLGGVVSDTALRLLSGAVVEVLGVRPQVKTNDQGEFFVPAASGSHVVRVERTGHRTEMFSVTIPEKEGLKVAVRLTPAAQAQTNRQAAMSFDLKSRLTWRKKTGSRIFSRAELDDRAKDDISQLATIGAGIPVDERCEAYIDGGPFKAPLWTFRPTELEFVEVYYGKARGPEGVRCNAAVYVWIRK
jgi:hypothetical protein